jgi:hypothetical protein
MNKLKKRKSLILISDLPMMPKLSFIEIDPVADFASNIILCEIPFPLSDLFGKLGSRLCLRSSSIQMVNIKSRDVIAATRETGQGMIVKFSDLLESFNSPSLVAFPSILNDMLSVPFLVYELIFARFLETVRTLSRGSWRNWILSASVTETLLKPLKFPDLSSVSQTNEFLFMTLSADIEFRIKSGTTFPASAFLPHSLQIFRSIGSFVFFPFQRIFKWHVNSSNKQTQFLIFKSNTFERGEK